MNDDSEAVTPLKAVDAGPEPDILLYDYSKFLLTTTLLAFGGVLTLSGMDGGVRPQALVVALVALLLSGFSSIAVIGWIIAARRKGEAAPNMAWTAHVIAIAALGAGVGAFTVTWLFSVM
ncbi:hypothetical protein [Alteriqipengyuania sp.]|uniref:hypothetical protein n=1 Tax=Alteriqipengyuania sp. TaxID=2800692 RepID=UPI00351340D4